MKTIDLHVHSDCSDGTLSPADLVAHAAEIGLSAFALTDHDCTDGISAAINAASLLPKPVELVPGIEFSTEYFGTDVHIVGLDIDYCNPDFQHYVHALRDDRLLRNQKMIQRMANDGIDISFDKMKQEFGDGVWTRAHFARYLAEHGYVSDIKAAFVTHIGEGCPYYVPREKVSPFEVTRTIVEYGGIPILAHPMLYHFDDTKLRNLLTELCRNGLAGIEIYYSTHTSEDISYLSGLAAEFHLLPSGGSDFHGTNKPDIALGTGKGSLRIPYSVLEHLRSAAGH